jgi:hypothetical protein
LKQALTGGQIAATTAASEAKNNKVKDTLTTVVSMLIFSSKLQERNTRLNFPGTFITYRLNKP